MFSKRANPGETIRRNLRKDFVVAKSKSRSNTSKPISVDNTVSMRKAVNGFVVSSYSNGMGKDRTYIAKNQVEAKRIASRLLGGGS